jgi:TP901 family phage tail tape measure protein
MKMLPNVLNLAAAGNMSLARASDMVTDAQTAFGLTLPETEKLVDKMAKTSSKTNTSVEQLGDAILTVGGTAKSLKGGTTELATMLGVLADNGIKGAEGGTALRNVILALSAPTDTAAEKLKELGVSAYDADGNMRALPDVFDDLNAAMDGMTQGEKTEVLNTIFNKVDLKSANALLATTGDRFNELETAIDGATGAAQEMASTQLDNLAGDVTLFKSALEGAKITVSNSLTPALRTFVQFGTKEITKLDKAFQRGGLNGFAEQLGKSLGDAVKMLVKQTPKFVQAAGKLALSLIDSLGGTIVSNFPKILKTFIKLVGDLGRSLVSRIPELMGGIGSIIGETIANIPNLLKLGIEIAHGLIQGIVKGLGQFAGELAKGFTGMFANPISEEVERSNEYLSELHKKLEETGMSAEDLEYALSKADTDASMAQYWLDVYDKLNSKTNLTKTEQEKLNTAVDELKKLFPEIDATIDENTGKWDLNTDAIENNIEAMKQKQYAEIYLEKMKGEMEKVVDLEIEIGKQQDELLSLQNKRDELTPRLEQINSALDTYGSELSGVQSATKKLHPTWAEGTALMKEYAASVGITEANFTSWDDVTTALMQEQRGLKSELDKTNSDIVAHESTIAALKTDYEAVSESVDKFGDMAAEASGKAKKFGEETANGYAAGMKDKYPVVAAAAKGLIDVAMAKMKSTAMIASPSKKFRKDVGQQIGQGEVLGLEDKIPDVKKASEKLVNAIDIDVPSMDIPSVTAQGESDTRINAIIAVLNKYLPKIGAPIVLDTGELVGATIDKFDHELGVMQQRRARYE